MQRVHAAARSRRCARRDQRLARDLAAEHALAVLVGAHAAEQVDLELLELEQVDEIVERAPHNRADATGAHDGRRRPAHPKKTAAVSKSRPSTVFSCATPSSIGTRTTSVPCSATIVAEVALVHRVDRLDAEPGRDHAVVRGRACRRAARGRARSCALRSRCAARSRRRAAVPIPPSRTWPKSSTSPVCSSIVPSFGVAPSATTTIEKFAPRWWRCVRRSQISSMSNGSSGIRMMSAPPAMPGVRRDPARVPAHHLDDHHPVVALGGRVQAVDRVGRDLHRGVEPEREVGRRTGRCRSSSGRRRRCTPSPSSLRATPSVSSPPIAMSASMRSRASVASTCRGPSSDLYGFVRDVPRIVPPRGSSPRDGVERQVHRLALDHAAPAVAVADDRVAVLADALAHDGPDHRVQARARTATSARRGSGSGACCEGPAVVTTKRSRRPNLEERRRLRSRTPPFRRGSAEPSTPR